MRLSRSRTPLRLQDLWKKNISRIRRVSITLKWDEAYLADVSSALIRNARKVTQLTFFLPKINVTTRGKEKHSIEGNEESLNSIEHI
ncbi:hypothetical protein CTAM01_13780 [Colletotrichum tamarilloi]|uniref:Uncharacterized protein n=1 Tax=Colletotrichum tamarilloi TaxID=1209934 RepID=A0ABQ9QR09_9PEZI|nr:uncharacterized protein CTAM01_13780 [Colletotrichum tamarilloi]KAK1481845.1 hypothetical protein CTAM01_13780 [Colletotrichum tamarilloi]